MKHGRLLQNLTRRFALLEAVILSKDERKAFAIVRNLDKPIVERINRYDVQVHGSSTAQLAFESREWPDSQVLYDPKGIWGEKLGLGRRKQPSE
jgi:hypothetical protein